MAVPAALSPAIMMSCSARPLPVRGWAARMPASTTAAVPCPNHAEQILAGVGTEYRSTYLILGCCIMTSMQLIYTVLPSLDSQAVYASASP